MSNTSDSASPLKSGMVYVSTDVCYQLNSSICFEFESIPVISLDSIIALIQPTRRILTLYMSKDGKFFSNILPNSSKELYLLLSEELDKSAATAEISGKTKEWILECWIHQDLLITAGSYLAHKCKLTIQGNFEAFGKDISGVLLSEIEAKRFAGMPAELEWSDVISKIQFSDWDLQIAENLFWSKEELVFWVVNRHNELLNAQHYLGLLNHFISLFGRAFTQELLSNWLGEDVRKLPILTD